MCPARWEATERCAASIGRMFPPVKQAYGLWQLFCSLELPLIPILAGELPEADVQSSF